MSKMFTKLLRKELQSYFSLLFCCNAALGLTGFLCVDIIRDQVSDFLNVRSKALLSADISVSTRREFTTDEIELIKSALPKEAALRTEKSLITMLRFKDESRLVDVQAVDTTFPFYGELVLKEGGIIQSHDTKSITTGPSAWIYDELRESLGLKIGDKIAIGQKEFEVLDFVIKDPKLASSGFLPAPKIYIGLGFMEETGLVQYGSRVLRELLVKLPEGMEPEQLLENLHQKIEATDIRLRSYKNQAQESGRALLILTDFLALVSLVALCLTALGIGYLFRGYLQARTKDIAIMLSMGLGSHYLTRLYISTVLVLAFISGVLAIFTALILTPVLQELLKNFLPEDFELQISIAAALKVLSLAMIGSSAITWPHLWMISTTKPQSLFKNHFNPNAKSHYYQLLSYIPAVGLFTALAFWQSKSINITALFIGLLLASSVLIALGAWLSAKVLKATSHKLGFILRLSVLQIIRSPSQSLTMIISLSLCMILINTIPSLHLSLKEELSYSQERPALFLFDIQDDQLKALAIDLDAMGYELGYRSPLIRARLDAVNGEIPYERQLKKGPQTREQEWADRMKNRNYNLSYRDKLFNSERILEGEDFPGAFDPSKDDLALVSIEQRFADRLGLGVGDVLRFHIQGIDLEAKIANLRHVKWTSFQPNFFIQFQPGVLDDSVKTWLAGISRLDLSQKVQIQKHVVQNYPNISVLDVESLLMRIQDIVEQMIAAMGFMSALTFVMAMLVIFSLAVFDIQRRRKDILILKAMGASRMQILSGSLMEYIILGAFAIGIGMLCAELSAFVLSHYVFESPYQSSFLTSLVNGLSALFFISVLCGLIILRLLAQKTRDLLSSL
jgi:putative ABC transport system permease protein